jgi:outer membrane protein assembly factor BamB
MKRVWCESFLRVTRASAVSWCLMMLTVAAVAAEVRLVASGEAGWPQFRGARRDGISEERGLLKSWPAGGPQVLWSVTNVGRGFSSPVISGGRLILSGDFSDHVALRAFDLQGRPLWRATNGANWRDPYPGARSTPTFSGGRLFHQNAHGRVAGFDAANGRELWAVDVLKQFGGSNITWGLSECLLVDERAVYVTAGGSEALVVALHKANGAVLWRTPGLRDEARGGVVENASYVSPILVQFGARRLLVGASLRNLYCVDADTGALQFTKPMPTTYSVLAMMPALVGDGIFMSAPHGKGGRLWRLKEEGARVSADEIWTTTLDTCQGCVVARDGKIFGSFYPGRKGWAAVDAKDGRVLYQAADMIKGAALWADERLYALSEDGWMRLLDPAATEFTERGKFRFTTARGNDAWAHPVILEGKLYLRYHDTLTCFDVKQ